MVYTKFTNEKDFLIKLLLVIGFRRWLEKPLGEFFPRIKSIARKKIYPDIDLLEIKESKTGTIIIGYELKLLKYDKIKGLSLNAFYQGIGQSLLLFKHGVHRSVLALAFHQSVTDIMVEEFKNDLLNMKNVLTAMLPIGHVGLALYLHEGSPLSYIVEPIENFQHSFFIEERVKFFREAIINRKFTYDKRLKKKLKQFGLPPDMRKIKFKLRL